MRGLYAILDTATLTRRRILPAAFATQVLAARPAALQIRAKDVTAREILALLRALGPMCRRAGVPLVCNDRPDLAVLGGCDFVHLGQEDPPVELVRRLFPQVRVGISTHDMAQLEQAIALRPAYVAFGPVFPTTSKERPDPVVGLEGLARASAVAREAKIPLVAIGGITLARAPEIAALADAAAVIGALVPDDACELGARSVAFQRALSGVGAEARP